MKIVVIGGTGLIGSKLVNKLREMGHEAVAASPNTGVNTITGAGLREALAGARVVVDVSNSPSFEEKAVMEFFTTSTRNLLAAEKTPAWAITWRCPSSAPTGCSKAVTSARRWRRRTSSRSRRFPTRSCARRSSSSSSRASRPKARTARAFAPHLRSSSRSCRMTSSPRSPRSPSQNPRMASWRSPAPSGFTSTSSLRQLMKATGDARQVITDAGTRYFGALLRGADADVRLSEHRRHDALRGLGGLLRGPRADAGAETAAATTAQPAR